LILPFLNISAIQQNIPQNYKDVYTKRYATVIQTSSTAINSETNIDFQWEWLIYIGVGISSLLFFLKLIRIFRTIKSNKTQQYKQFKKVNINDDSTAFSFFKYIFIGSQISEHKQQEIIKHELIHIKQKHSLDLIFFEILRILFWYNPLIYLYQKRITDVHEFLVDKELTLQLTEKTLYFETILSEVFQTENLSLSSSFYNPSLIKKRVQMLTRMKSSNQRLLKYFFIIPIILLSLTYVACNKEVLNLAEEKDTKIDSSLNSTTDYSNWQATNYKTGEVPACLRYTPIFDYQINNNLLIRNINYGNTDATEAVVKLIYLKNHLQKNSEEITARTAFIKIGESHTMKNIPEGKYYLKIAYGTEWKESTINNKCIGRFTINPQYEKGDDIVDFSSIKTPDGIEFPSYQLSLDVPAP